jgi:hypothetical protein
MTTEQYLFTHVLARIRHPERTAHHTRLNERNSDTTLGDPNISIGWDWVSKAGERSMEPHAHDFDQYFTFLGGDPNDILDLNGEGELALSEDGVKQEIHTFSRATSVFIPKGLYHCPLV